MNRFDAVAFGKLSYAEREAVLDGMRDEIKRRLALLAQTATPPAAVPESTQPPATTAVNLPTRRMRAAMQRFDALPDNAQIAQLKELWR